MSYETLTVQKDGGVGVVALNRPDKMNSMNPKMKEELPQALADMATDSSIRALIVTGTGRAFCAGADLGEGIIVRSTSDTLGRGGAASLAAELRDFQRIVLILRQMEKPVIGAINGAAVGAGFGIALACDIRIASEKATFGMVFARVGLVPDFGGSYFLPRVVGTAKACELILTGDIFDAAEAHRLGILNKVVAPEQTMAEAMALATRLAEGPPIAMALSKASIYQEMEMTLAQAIDYEAAMQAIAMQTEDHVEGVKAFRERRKPAFQGR